MVQYIQCENNQMVRKNQKGRGENKELTGNNVTVSVFMLICCALAVLPCEVSRSRFDRLQTNIHA